MEPINLDNTSALERIAFALEDISRGLKKPEPAGAEPAGIPIMLIVEVLIALIRFVRARRESPADRTELSRLLAKLEHYQPVRPAGKEAE